MLKREITSGAQKNRQFFWMILSLDFLPGSTDSIASSDAIDNVMLVWGLAIASQFHPIVSRTFGMILVKTIITKN